MALTVPKKRIAICGMVLDKAPPRGSHIVMWTLANAFSKKGHAVDFIVFAKPEKTFPWALPEGIRLVRLKKQSHFIGWLDLVHYMVKEKPDILLCGGTRANVFAPLLPRLKETRIVAVLHTMLSEEFRQWHGIKKWRKVWAARALLNLDGVIAVSNAVVKDFQKLVGHASPKVRAILNPVDLDHVRLKAKEPVNHPFLGQGPLILGVGALVKNKDFATLIKAFSFLPKEMNAHLIILGEGQERQRLLELAKEFKVIDRLDLPGFMENPYAWMAKSQILAVTSKAEGFCNVLAEAQALGVPSVSTRCPGGPEEILDHGRYGLLVDVGDAKALARALLQTLKFPPEAKILQEAAVRFAPNVVAEHYLGCFFDDCKRYALSSLAKKTEKV
jgi:glycosyltransferase involved in cell wall biosynthesis